MTPRREEASERASRNSPAIHARSTDRYSREQSVKSCYSMRHILNCAPGIGWVPRSNDGGREGGRAHRASETSKVYDLAAVRKGVCDPRFADFTAESS